MATTADPIGQLAAKLDGHHFGQIVGIPRGGLIVAAALGWRLDVATVLAYAVDYQRPNLGPPRIGRPTCLPVDVAGRRILLVEDGVATGTLLNHAHAHLYGRGAIVITAALWVSRGHGYRPDVWVDEVDVLPSGATLLR